MKQRKLLIFFFVLLFMIFSQYGISEEKDNTSKELVAKKESKKPSSEFSQFPKKGKRPSEKASISFVGFFTGPSKTELPDDEKSASYNLYSTKLSFNLPIPINDTITIDTGIGWGYYFFDGVRSTDPIPKKLQYINIKIGMSYTINPNWKAVINVTPGIYSDFNGVTDDDIRAGVFLGAVYVASPKFMAFFGLNIDPMSDIPVFPIIGIRWQFAEDWLLDSFGGGTPKIEYSIIKHKLNTYLGLHMSGGTFRVAKNFGSKRSSEYEDFDNTWLSYREFGVGAGFNGRLFLFKWDVQAGYMFYRTFKYEDEDTLANDGGALYIKIGINGRF